jgi:hypothetical protein
MVVKALVLAVALAAAEMREPRERRSEGPDDARRRRADRNPSAADDLQELLGDKTPAPRPAEPGCITWDPAAPASPPHASPLAA